MLSARSCFNPPSQVQGKSYLWIGAIHADPNDSRPRRNCSQYLSSPSQLCRKCEQPAPLGRFRAAPIHFDSSIGSNHRIKFGRQPAQLRGKSNEFVFGPEFRIAGWQLEKGLQCDLKNPSEDPVHISRSKSKVT